MLLVVSWWLVRSTPDRTVRVRALARGGLGHTYIHEFILSGIYRVVKKLISPRKEKQKENKITLLRTNYIFINAV